MNLNIGIINFFWYKNVLKYLRLLNKITAVAVVILTTASRLSEKHAVAVIRFITNLDHWHSDLLSIWEHIVTDCYELQWGFEGAASQWMQRGFYTPLRQSRAKHIMVSAFCPSARHKYKSLLLRNDSRYWDEPLGICWTMSTLNILCD